MAFSGWGVWSLVWRNVAQNIINSLLLWLWNGWRPAFIFSIKSFRELFGFGSKLLISGLLDTTFTNIYYLVIGKYYSAVELGFYTRADQFKNFPSQNLTSVIQRVSYPALASIQTDPQRLKRGYKDLIKNAMLVSFVLMIGMATVAKPLVITLIGKKWLPLVPYLQLLCLSGMLYPLHALNLNMLAVQGRSDLFLKLEIIKKTLVIPVLIIGVLWGIKIMILGMFINSIIAYFLNSYWSGKMINYSMKEQINDILPSFYIALIMAAIVWFVGTKLPMQYPAFVLSLQIILGSCVVILSAHLINLDAYFQMKDIIRKNIIHVKV
jgi:O-antigen/teichoic acid export membrane protein